MRCPRARRAVSAARRVRCAAAWALPAALLLLPDAARACPGCKEALFDADQIAQNVASARGYALSIGLMLAVPFLLVGGAALAIARAARRHRKTSHQPS